jgi:tRNA(Ile)-lysidine synthase
MKHVLGAIARHGMLTPGQRVGVAVSGGADSVCLLHVLRELPAPWNLPLVVLHVNHELRGAESESDEHFVRSLAARLGLECLVRRAPVAGTGDNLEQAARRARLEFFRETLTSGTVDRVALGHTRSDQAETVLFRFLRGSGTTGLAAIRPVTADGLVRPLIEVDRAGVTSWLEERGIGWREDSTNASPEFARNRIRHRLLPQLADEWNPAIAETLAQTADFALAEEAYWAAEIDRLAAQHLQQTGDEVLIRADALLTLPLAAARRLVRRAIGMAKGDLRAIDFGHIGRALEVAADASGGRAQMPGIEVCHSFDWVRIAPSGREIPYRLPIQAPGLIQVPGTGLGLSLELLEKPESSGRRECVYNDRMGCLDWDRLSGPLELRNWQPGDRYQPVGAAAEEKVKDLFQTARIPLWKRTQWPVLTDRRGIIWVRSFGSASGCEAGPASSVVLRVREVSVA